LASKIQHWAASQGAFTCDTRWLCGFLPQILTSGNRPVLSPGVVKQALRAIGGYPLSPLPDLLDGRLAAPL
jgi:hypothetical protein